MYTHYLFSFLKKQFMFVSTAQGLTYCKLAALVKAVAFSLLYTLSASSNAQDLSTTNDLEDSELSRSLSTTVNFTGALGGTITIGQYGLYNTTNIIQAGSDSNVIEVTQEGYKNFAEITQLGIDNTVILRQAGKNNLFKIIQDGNANTANVHQLGEQSFIVRQIGNEMVVNITQYQQ